MQVDADCHARYQELRTTRTGPKFVLFKIDNTHCVVDYASESTATFDDFLAALPANEARWAILTINFETVSGGRRSKVVFVSWIPSASSRVDKMSYAMFQGTLKRALTGVQCSLQAHDLSDLEPEVVLEHAARFERDAVNHTIGVQ
eukprot:m.283097 g.283097  ORF g.283097 m.283097 type:complete len:146 (-) comp11117_c1_seq2:168-605(-)